MNIQFYSLSKENPSIPIILNPEMELLNIHPGSFQPSKPGEVVSLCANIKLKRVEDELIMESFSAEANMLSFIKRLTEKIKTTGGNMVEITLEGSENTDAKLDFTIHFGRERLDLKPLFKDFQNHIENPLNTRIIFSAPFGHGKTTFLNTFFEEDDNSHYEVFRVFPVNYSVSSNEDIFRYIKTDILFQLLTRDVEFEKSGISILTAAEELLYLQPEKIIVSLLEVFSSLNSTVMGVTTAIKNLTKLKSEIETYQANNSIDERKVAMEFVQEIYDKEGSLFEDNFFTQLIRGLLEQISFKEKETVLIIEDLDRIDPEHIFRILNVISAHYDTYHLTNDWGIHNRFGFDKIILVCDSKNIQSIFHHKYGEQTNFDGYFNKYYSSKPFEFDNSALVKIDFLKQFSRTYSYYDKSSSFQLFLFILGILIENQALSIRELQKLHQFGYSETYLNSKTKATFSNSEIVIDCFTNFEKSISLEKLKGKLSNIRKKMLPVNHSQISKWTLQFLSVQAYFDGSLSESWLIDFKQQTYTFTQNSGDELVRNVNQLESSEEIQITLDDFFESLIRAIDKINPFLKADKNKN